MSTHTPSLTRQTSPRPRLARLVRLVRPFAGAAIVLGLLALLARTGAAGKSTTPAELVGSWSWTKIGSVGYVDTNTHQLAAPSGMSARFTFTADGRYTMFFYVRQQTYGMVTESTTTHEGTVVFADDGSFTMKPKKGHYRGHTGARVIDRAMTAAERKPLTYRWQWRDDDDGRHLYLGPSADALSRFLAAG
jgi:hypothetical protein